MTPDAEENGRAPAVAAEAYGAGGRRRYIQFGLFTVLILFLIRNVLFKDYKAETKDYVRTWVGECTHQFAVRVFLLRPGFGYLSRTMSWHFTMRVLFVFE